MRKQDKIFFVDNLTETFKKAKAISLINYQGLDVPQITKLRSLVKKADGKLLVVKNTLLKRALEAAKLPLPAGLEGPTAIIISQEDEISPIKAVADFASQEDLPVFKSGVYQARLLTKEEIEKLSQLPGKNLLLAGILGLLNLPTSRLTSILSENQRKVIFLLRQKASLLPSDGKEAGKQARLPSLGTSGQAKGGEKNE